MCFKMAAPKTRKTTANDKGEKIVKPVNSIHIVVYACTHCGEEIEELKLCTECDSPMKVIQVIEKFGSEADEYLKELKKDGNWSGSSVTPPKKAEATDDGSISDDDLDSLDIPIMGIEEENDEPAGLGEIFPDDGDEDSPSTPSQDIDFMEALDKLDEEEDVDDLHDLGPDGLPEL